MGLEKFTLYWHMIIRGHLGETLLAVNSLQGLYDGIVIAVDDREDSDEVYEALSHFPNMYAYRQNFEKFGRYDLARQDCLDKVPYDCNFVGWSDSDEVLVTDPYQVRKWLSETRPESVNCGIHYVYPIGGHEAGKTYRNGRVRIWKHGTRIWTRPCHEYPSPINGIDDPVIGDVIFNHIKQDNKEYRADHHIELMQKEIDSGILGWMFFQAKEYQIKQDISGAKRRYLDYIRSGEISYLDDAIVQLCELYLTEKDYYGIVAHLNNKNIPDHPMIKEYIAIALYWLGAKKGAAKWHKKAKELDKENRYSVLSHNDIYFN